MRTTTHTLLILLLTLLGSCGQKGSTSAKLGVSLSGIVANSTAGGGLYLEVLSQDGRTESYKLPNADAAVDIPNGLWKFHVVAYGGPAAWDGVTRCGQSPDFVSLEGGEKSVNISISVSNCGTSPFAGMIERSMRERLLSQFGATTRKALADHSGFDECKAFTKDAQGYLYCAGTTNSSMGEISGGNADAFVMKLTPNGKILWLTQLGANTSVSPGFNAGSDGCNGIALDSAGNVYCAGATNGNVGAINAGGWDTLVIKLSPSGALLWARQLGGSGTEKCYGVTVDPSGNVYCAGETDSPSVFGGSTQGQDGFVYQLNSSGAFQWGRLISGTGSEVCQGVALDPTAPSAVYCAGSTTSGLYGSNSGDKDAFVVRIDTSTSGIVWGKQIDTATLAGATGHDYCNAVAVKDGFVYCAGETFGSLGEANGGSSDAFVMRLNASTGALSWLTQLGAATRVAGLANNALDTCKSVAVKDGFVYCAGTTLSSMGESNGGSTDAFIAQFDASSGALNWLTQFGLLTYKDSSVANGAADSCLSVLADANHVYCAGTTTGAMGESAGGGGDAFIARLAADGTF